MCSTPASFTVTNGVEATSDTATSDTGELRLAPLPVRMLTTVALWSPALTVLGFMALFGHQLAAPLRLAQASVALYAALKVTAAIKQRDRWQQVPAEGWLWYATLWPGMDLLPFTRSVEPNKEPVAVEPAWLGRGIGGMVVGTAIVTFTVLAEVSDWVGGWLMICGLLALVHFGWADILSWAMRSRGFAVRRLFRPPERATTLNDFWTRRWNRAFVEMDQILFMPALRRYTGRWAPALMLGLSGVMHELALSFPGGGGWGLPMIYFAGHGLAMQAERTDWFSALPVTATRWWTRIWVLAPVALVFHRPFRDALPLELLNTLKGIS